MMLIGWRQLMDGKMLGIARLEARIGNKKLVQRLNDGKAAGLKPPG